MSSSSFTSLTILQISSSHRRDFSNSYSNGSTSGFTRSRASKYDSEDHSEEYKKIMASTDKYVTMAKYSSGQSSDTNNMIEEERRSKAYSKIIGSAQSTVSIIAQSWSNSPTNHCRKLTTTEPL